MRTAALVLLVAALPAPAMTPEGKEFVEISRTLESVQCEKRKLRREIAAAEAEQRRSDAAALRKRFAALSEEPQTARLEKRLGELERRISDGKGGVRDREDLQAISDQQRAAFYRCD